MDPLADNAPIPYRPERQRETDHDHQNARDERPPPLHESASEQGANRLHSTNSVRRGAAPPFSLPPLLP